jgi:hypothetical protein
MPLGCAEERQLRRARAGLSRIELIAAASSYLSEAPVFLGTEFEAYSDRGGGDMLASHDLEDIISVLDGRLRLLEEVENVPAELRAYLTGGLAEQDKD